MRRPEVRFCQDLDKGLGEWLIKSNRRARELGVERETRGTFKVRRGMG